MKVTTAAIIVNWNSWHELDRCLDALCKQSSPFNRIVVIDNGSTDPKPGSLSRWQAQANMEFLFLTDNSGFACANNIGIQKVSDCDWVALVNPDAFLETDWHLQMKRAILNNPAVASYSSPLVMSNEKGRWDGLGDAYHISGLVWRKAHGRQRDSYSPVGGTVFSPCAAAALFRRETLLESGGFDEDYFCYVEDVDLGFRLRLLGYDCMLAPHAIAYHVGSATTGGKHSDFAVYHGHRNIVWTFVKDMPGILLWLLLPLHILMNFAAVVIFTLRGQGKVITKAKWDAIKGLPHIIRKRKVVQSSRRCSVADIWRILDKRLFIGKLRD